MISCLDCAPAASPIDTNNGLACVYRKPKLGRSGDEVRQGPGVSLSFQPVERGAPFLLDFAKSQSQKEFVERVKREFAELNGVDVSKVIVEFRIIS
jgi:hypothetical protein